MQKTNAAKLALIVGVAGALQGCTYLSAQSRANPRAVAIYKTPDCPVTQQKGDTRDGAIDLDCFKFHEKDVEFAYRAAVGGADDEVDARNRLIAVLMKHSDDACTFTLGKMYSDEATYNTSLGILSTGLSGAAAIVSGEQAKSILSGLSSLSGASRDHINVNVYRSQISSAISQAINNRRAEVRGQILAKYELPKKKWSVDDGIRDVNLYHQECSFYRGIELVLTSVQDKKALQGYLADRETEIALTSAKATLTTLESSAKRLKEPAAVASADKAIADLQATIASLEKARLEAQKPSQGVKAVSP